MSRNMNWETFASIYNNTSQFPSLAAVAQHLGLSLQTVKNRAALLRTARRNGKKLPNLISRARTGDRATAGPEDHANIRARMLAQEIRNLVTSSRYPLVNPEAIVVDSALTRTYDKAGYAYRDREGTPRTWLTDTLRIAPVLNPRNRKFIFTGAQNDAPVHIGFWKNLQAFARHVGADIVVGAWTYETQWWSENNTLSRAYASEIADYLCFGQMEIGDHFVFCGEMNTLPTASRPVSDLMTYPRNRWAVFPHAKIQLKSVPSTDPGIQAHQVMTSGAVTYPKIIPRKAGVKSIFHHVIGAVLVEFDEQGDVFCRHLVADDDGSFYDLDRFACNGHVTTGHSVKSIVFADIHRAKLRSKSALSSFGLDLAARKITNRNNPVDALRPERIFLHDLFDNQTRNHHEEKDVVRNYELALRGKDAVIDEVIQAAEFLVDIRRDRTQIIVVDSNHDLALERYVREGRYRGDGKNYKIGLKLDLAYTEHRERVARALEAEEAPPTFSLFEYAARNLTGQDLQHVQWVHDGRSFVVDGVECGHHGFRGCNGAKGTVAGFARIGRKMTIGDKHTPEIMDGVYVAGALELQQGYNKGPSSWAVSHVVQYPNGTRAMISLQNHKWRAAPSRAATKHK